MAQIIQGSGETVGEYQTKKAIFRSYQVIWYVVWFIEIVLGFRFVLRLFGANPVSPFVEMVYGVSGVFLAPFRGIFPNSVASGAVAEWSILVAMAVYLLVGYGVVAVFQVVKPTNPQEVDRNIDVP